MSGGKANSAADVSRSFATVVAAAVDGSFVVDPVETVTLITVMKATRA